MNRFVTCDPVTGQTLADWRITTSEETGRAVQHAAAAALAWRALPVAERAARLLRLRDGLAADADLVASTVAREIGKPLQDAYAVDLLATVQALSWVAHRAPRLLRPRRLRGVRSACLLAEPYGVVGVIGTWNYPLFLDLTAIIAALAAGNAVVWKPSELATLSASVAHAHCERAGLPVVLITGDGVTGRALCRAAIDKLAFTGSVATGRAILAELAARGTPSVMELSGNDAMIVCADADIGLAARSAVWARCVNAGQSCVSPQRIYVESPVYDLFLARCGEALRALRPGIDYGPLRTGAFREQVDDLVCASLATGARLLVGGRAMEDRPGFYYAPTLLADCDDETPAVTRGFFGPVLPVCRVGSEEEAIERANRCDMALGASVWTGSRARGQRIAARLQAGVVTINQETLLSSSNPALPFGGLRASGFGRLRGAAGLEEFVQWKSVVASGEGGARRHLFPYRKATLPILSGLIALRAARNAKAKLEAARRLARAAMAWKDGL